MLSILFRAVSETLLLFGVNPENGLGGKLGFISILHTWDQLLLPHFHLHCLVPGGAMSGDAWISCSNDYLFSQEALSRVFRGKFIDHMTVAYKNGELVFPGVSAPLEKPEKFQELKDTLYSKNWVVHVKEPIKRPEYVLDYLGRYTHRVAIANSRIVSLREGRVTIKYKNRETDQMETKTMTAVEFIRRFLLHTLPKRFVRIRHYGFLANRNRRKNIQKIKSLFDDYTNSSTIEKTTEELMLQIAGVDPTQCPLCKKGKMKKVLKYRRDSE